MPATPQLQSNNTVPADTVTNSPISISTEDGARQVLGVLDEAMKDHNADDVKDIAERLAELVAESTHLNTQRPKLYAAYQDAIARARWLYLSALSPAQLENLFRDSFEYFFDYDWEDVLYQVRALLRTSVDIEERDAWKEKWRHAIAASQALIGTAQLNISGSAVPPTIQNWLRDFRDVVHGNAVDSLVIVEYVNNNQHARAVTNEEREQLEHLLKFDQELTKSSETMEGLENSEILPDPAKGTYVIFTNGQIVDTEVPIQPERLQELREAYQLDAQGKPISIAQYIKNSSTAREQLKKTLYAQPNVVPLAATATAPARTTTSTVTSTSTQIPTPMVTPMATPTPIPAPVPAPQKQKVNTAVQTITDLVKRAEAAERQQTATTRTTRMKQPAAPSFSSAPTPLRRMDYADIAQHVLGSHKLLFPSIEVEKRFLSIITSYLAGVRDRMEAHDALVRPVEVGGVNISQDIAGRVLMTADETVRWYQLQQSQHRKEKKLPTQNVQRPDFEHAQQMMAEKKKAEERTAERVSIEPEDVFANVSPIFDESMNRQPASRQPAQMQPISPTQSSNRKKPVITDILQPRSTRVSTQAVMGPMDELHAMNLSEFRRYGNARIATQKIIDKLNLLEEESVTKKAEGMRAWQGSPINQLYLMIGNRSLEKSIPVGMAIQQMEARGEETLTEEEFESIADLNQSIRF